jgi:hypothetical protein
MSVRLGGRTAVLAYIFCLTALLLGAPPSTAAAAAPPVWSAPTLVDHAPPFGSPHELTAISCPSDTLCVAVDGEGFGVTSHDPTAATPTWSLPQPVVSTGGWLTSIACPSISLCVAVTGSGTVQISNDPAAESPTWSEPTMIDPVPDGTPPNNLSSISCPSAALCVAVNWAGDAVISTDPAAATPHWTRSPAHINPNPLSGVSCPSTALCVAVDMQGGVAITTNPTAATPTWTAYAGVDGALELTGIACPSTTLCVAVDTSGNVVTSTDPAAAAPTWTVTQASTRSLRAVACPSTTLCIGVGNGGNLAVSTNPPASDWVQKGAIAGSNNVTAIACSTTSLCHALLSGTAGATHSTDPGGSSTSWSPATQIDGTNSFKAVACPAETLCLAVDDAGHMARTLNPTAVAPVWELISRPGNFTDVSCPSTALCVAVARDASVTSSIDPGAATPTWFREVTGFYPLVGVSCPSTAFCMTIDNQDQSRVSTVLGVPYDPDNVAPRWSDPAALPYATVAQAISCPTTGLCAIAGAYGRVAITTNPGATPTWSLTADPLSFDLADIACPTVGVCIATDYSGAGFVSTNPAAATPAWSAPQSGVGVTLACATASFCMGTLGPDTSFSTDPASPGEWTPQQALPDNGRLTGLSCAAPELCAAVDDSGRALLRVAPPANTAPPTLSGTAAVGQTLTAGDGSWTVLPAVARQWERCDAGGNACAAIDGATGSAFAVSASDAGHTLRVRETAANGGGRTDATSAISGVVPAPPVAPAGVPTSTVPTTPAAITPTISRATLRARLLRALTPKRAAAKLRTLVKRGGFVSSFAAPSAGRLVLRWYTRPRNRKAKAVLLATSVTRITRAGTTKPKLKLTKAGKRLLRKSKRITITAKGSFTAPRAAAVTASRTLKLKR